MPKKISYIPDKGKLVVLNIAAETKGYNRVIAPGRLKDIADAKYPISMTIVFDDYVRCRVIMNDIADIVWLDMDIMEYNALPTEIVP